MGVLFIDGFDKYGPAGLMYTTYPTGWGNSSGTYLPNLLTANEWNSVTMGGTSAIGIIAGLSSTGYALQFGSWNGVFCWVTKTLPGNYATLIGGVRFSTSLGAQNFILLSDGATTQCSITVETTGKIMMRTASTTGTALATSAGSVTANTTHYLEWQITIGASAAYQVWLDGVSIFSGTGNTRSSGVSQVNNMQIGTGPASSSGQWNLAIDDFYLFDTTGSVNNAPLLTNPRVETQYPSGDAQTQFSNGASILGQAYSAGVNTNAPGANQLFLRRFTPSASCTINSISTIPGATSGSANFRPAIYSDSAGAPGSLLSTGSAVTGATSGAALTAALTTPQSLTAGTFYWIGFITDTSVALQLMDTTTTGYRVAATYASGAPASPSGFTTGQSSWVLWGNCTGATTNWSSQTDNPGLSGLTYAYSSTVSQNDLYSFPALSATPQNIYTVAVKSYGAKTDTGTRTLSLNMKSGSATSTGSNTGIAPGTSFGWLGSFFDTDPNTVGVAWTGAGLNAATSGPLVAS